MYANTKRRGACQEERPSVLLVHAGGCHGREFRQRPAERTNIGFASDPGYRKQFHEVRTRAPWVPTSVGVSAPGSTAESFFAASEMMSQSYPGAVKN